MLQYVGQNCNKSHSKIITQLLQQLPFTPQQLMFTCTKYLNYSSSSNKTRICTKNTHKHTYIYSSACAHNSICRKILYTTLHTTHTHTSTLIYTNIHTHIHTRIHTHIRTHPRIQPQFHPRCVHRRVYTRVHSRCYCASKTP